MSRLHLPTPHTPGQLDPELAPNGATPRSGYLRRAADAMNTIATYGKKLLVARSQNIQSLAGGGATTVSPWPFYFHAGENTVGLRFHLSIVDTDYGSATDPIVTLTVKLAADGSTVVSEVVHQNARRAPASIAQIPNRLTKHSADLVGLDPDTDYYVEIACDDGARLMGMTCYELADHHADDTVAGVVDPTKFLADGPIYDEHVEDLLGAGRDHWKHSGCHYLSWAPDYATTESISATSYTNVLDGSSTSVSGATPGMVIASQYHGSITTPAAGPAVKIAVKATRTAGAGSLSVQLNDGTHTIALTGITTGGVGGWYVGTGNIPSQVAKWDLQAKVSAGGTTFDLEAVCVFAYEA
jgi:hypothetical protein